MFIFLDTETTGNGFDDRLCQIAFKAEVGPAICGICNLTTTMMISIHQQSGQNQDAVLAFIVFENNEYYRYVRLMETVNEKRQSRG
jgi:hypothetical protein